MLRLNLKNRAQKFIDRLPPKHAGQVARKIVALRLDPVPPDSKNLHGTSFRGADIGEYRIIYYVTEDVLHIPLIGKRNDSEVYRELKRLG